jgi:hypothetical protein
MKLIRFMGALLLAAPLFSTTVEPELLAFQLNETRTQVTQRLGPPTAIAPAGEFESWQYQIGMEDNHEFSHYLLFRIATGELISITRNYEHGADAEALFPPAETQAHFLPDDPTYGARVRRLPGARVLIAMGSTKPGQPVDQLLLIRESELKFFAPWVSLRQ